MADLKTSREIAHDAMYAGLRTAIPEVGGPTVNLIALGARAGMIEALRAVIRKVDGCDEPECAGQCAYEFANSKLAELEKS